MRRTSLDHLDFDVAVVAARTAVRGPVVVADVCAARQPELILCVERRVVEASGADLLLLRALHCALGARGDVLAPVPGTGTFLRLLLAEWDELIDAGVPRRRSRNVQALPLVVP